MQAISFGVKMRLTSNALKTTSCTHEVAAVLFFLPSLDVLGVKLLEFLSKNSIFRLPMLNLHIGPFRQVQALTYFYRYLTRSG